MLSLPNVYSQRLPEDAQSTYLYAHGYTAVFAIKIYIRVLAIDFHSYQALGIYTAAGGWANRTEYVSSAHPFSYILTSPHHGHLIHTLW